jgi:hypothetical protein
MLRVLVVAVYIMIRDPVVPSSFTGDLVGVGGHGVLLYGAVFCVALVPGNWGFRFQACSRCIEEVWGARARRIRYPTIFADQEPRFQRRTLIGHRPWSCLDDSLASLLAGHRKILGGFVTVARLNLWSPLPQSAQCCNEK